MDNKLVPQRPSLQSLTSFKNSPWIADILQVIFSYSTNLTQLTSYCLVNRAWYSEAIRIIWREPQFETQVNFRQFKLVISHSKHLASLVHVLDLQDYRYFILKYAASLLQYLPNLTAIRFPQAIPITRNVFSLLNACNFSALKSLNYVEIYFSKEEDIQHLESILRNCPNLEKMGLIVKSVAEYEILTDIVPLSSLKWLEVAGLELTGDLMKSLLRLTPNLARLETFTTAHPNDFVPIIVDSCKHLEHLHLEFEYAEEDILWDLCDEYAKDLVSHLKHFSLVYNQIVHDVPEEWMEILWRSFKSVETLRLWRVELNEAIIYSFSEALPKQLRILDLCSISVTEPSSLGAWEEFFVSCGGQLTSLTISHSLLPARLGHVIAKYCVRLEELVIRSCKFTDTSVIAVVQRCGSTLTKIKLYDTSFTESSLQAICENCNKLEELTLFRTEHWLQPLDTSPLVPYIVNHGAILRSLCIRGWKTTNELLNNLANHAQNLRELDFENDTGLQDSILQQVMKSCQLRQLNITTRHDCGGLTAEMIELVDKYYVFAKRIQNPLSLDMETIYGILYGSP
ncbi:putative VIER F-box protein 1 [Basidiobolus ranarum]|uniref:VIER F-box protein 1 n=1 Tax=Basidiobolus ranarum TaxID=34480 RepID=A0ABR2VWW8_9FUNG